jgi:predicted Ser/Thr protein kinase
VPEQQSAAVAGWVGRVLAGHRIEALIGEGGMGVVYRASHLHLRRTVALKVLPPSLTADREYRHRFEREAAIAASLEHPNVVPIYDAGYANGVLYLSMRFVDGEDLGAVLQREGRLDVEPLCALLEPVADALDAVHAAGLVHRDVKPGNVLISRSGRRHVYLCDFGIAKAAAGGRELTAAGQYMGTVHYSSPEQIEGRWVDGRSDQYGLACLAFRALTGQVPYPRPETAAVIYAHLAADPPRPSLQRPDLPPAVDAAVARATAKQPERRFPTCMDFIAALRAAVQPRPTPRPRRPLPPTLPLPEPDLGAPKAAAPDATTSRAAVPEPRAAGPGATPTEAPDAASAARVPSARQATPDAVPAPTDVRAERGPDDPSITVTWTATGGGDVEYKLTRLAADGRRHVVGRTRATYLVDGAVAPDAPVPAYEVLARVGPKAAAPVRSAPADPGGIPAVRNLTVSPRGALVFDWPDGVTEAMVVVRGDRPPAAPDDPAATAWKITNMRYQLDGGLVLPTSVARPCHVAVASCRRDGGALVVAPGFGATARVAVG